MTNAININQNKIHNDSMKKVITFILVFGFVFYWFESAIKPFYLGDYACMLAIILSIIYLKDTVITNIGPFAKGMIALYLFNFIITLLVAPFHKFFNLIDFFVRIARMGMCLYILLLFQDIIDVKYAIKCLIYIAVISALYLFVQVGLYNFFNIDTGFYFNGRRHGTYIEHFGDTFAFRPCAFFIEPGAYSHVITFVMILIMFFSSMKLSSKLLLTIFLYLSVLATTSTYGVVMGGMFLVIGTFYLAIKHRKYGIIWSFIFLCIVFILLLLVTNNNVLNYFIMKIQSMKYNERLDSISDFATHLPILEQIFGVGVGNEEFYYESIGLPIVTLYNGIIIQFFSSGYIGIMFFVLLMAYWCVYVKKECKMIILYVAILLIASSNFTIFQTYFVMLIGDVWIKKGESKHENIIH